MADLRERCVLEIGCGRGDWLADLEAWGARRERLAAIELDPATGLEAQARFAGWRAEDGALIARGADIRIGDATRLPWPDGSFDLVLQSTVFSSVLRADVRRAIAGEIQRVLRPDGAILWYDLCVDNPRNAAVRGVRAGEICALFPAYRVRLRRITLAPPLARRLAPVSWLAAEVLERLAVLNTHYLGVLRRESDAR
jgi:SAM-dependent methyltransferase